MDELKCCVCGYEPPQLPQGTHETTVNGVKVTFTQTGENCLRYGTLGGSMTITDGVIEWRCENCRPITETLTHVGEGNIHIGHIGKLK